jgi:hypothetical protein
MAGSQCAHGEVTAGTQGAGDWEGRGVRELREAAHQLARYSGLLAAGV